MKKIVVIIPSYKNERWCIKNIESVLSQDYENFRVIFTDDLSPDNTLTLVENYVNSKGAAEKVEIVKNSERVGALKNIYDMIYSCDDNDIIVNIDGDDDFTHNSVLTRISKEYDKDVWMTYGSYQDWPNKSRGCCRPYEPNVINSNLFRNVPWRASHARTFYAWLFKKIKLEDFYDPKGKFLDMAWDVSIMLPLLELSGSRHSYIHDILYNYNNENPISDYKVNVGRQGMLDGFIRRKPKYNKID